MGILKSITNNILQKLNSQVTSTYSTTVAYPAASLVNYNGVIEFTPTATAPTERSSFHETNAFEYVKAFIDGFTSSYSGTIKWKWDTTNKKPICEFLPTTLTGVSLTYSGKILQIEPTTLLNESNSKHTMIANTPYAYSATMDGEHAYQITYNGTSTTIGIHAISFKYYGAMGNLENTSDTYYDGSYFYNAVSTITGTQAIAQSTTSYAADCTDITIDSTTTSGILLPNEDEYSTSNRFKIFLEYYDTSGVAHSLEDYQSMFTCTVIDRPVPSEVRASLATTTNSDLVSTYETSSEKWMDNSSSIFHSVNNKETITVTPNSTHRSGDVCYLYYMEGSGTLDPNSWLTSSYQFRDDTERWIDNVTLADGFTNVGYLEVEDTESSYRMTDDGYYVVYYHTSNGSSLSTLKSEFDITSGVVYPSEFNEVFALVSGAPYINYDYYDTTYHLDNSVGVGKLENCTTEIPIVITPTSSYVSGDECTFYYATSYNSSWAESEFDSVYFDYSAMKFADNSGAATGWFVWPDNGADGTSYTVTDTSVSFTWPGNGYSYVYFVVYHSTDSSRTLSDIKASFDIQVGYPTVIPVQIFATQNSKTSIDSLMASQTDGWKTPNDIAAYFELDGSHTVTITPTATHSTGDKCKFSCFSGEWLGVTPDTTKLIDPSSSGTYIFQSKSVTGSYLVSETAGQTLSNKTVTDTADTFTIGGTNHNIYYAISYYSADTTKSMADLEAEFTISIT